MPDPRNQQPDPPDTGVFVAEFARHSQRVYSYILSLVANVDDADEVYQDTSTTAWEKFATFEPGTNFGAWICKIAYYRAMQLHDKRSGDPHVFDAELLDLISQSHERDTDLLAARRKALTVCVGELPDPSRTLIEQRYTGATAEQIGERTGRSANAVYKSLYRIHRILHECIDRRVDGDSGKGVRGGDA